METQERIKKASQLYTITLSKKRVKRKINTKILRISSTSPDLTLGVDEIMHRSNLGMVQQHQQGVYLGSKYREFIGFENMDKIEKHDVIKSYTAQVADVISEQKQKMIKHQQEEQRIQIEALKAQAIAEHEKAKASS